MGPKILTEDIIRNEMDLNEEIAGNYLSKGKIYPLQLEIELTRRCNLNCWHCWRNFTDFSGEELTDQEILRMIRCFPREHLRRIEFPGAGEPMLRKNLIHEIHRKFSTGIEYALTTNGTLFTMEDVLKFVNRSFNVIYLSLDMPGVEHDRNRGAGVFRKVDDLLVEFAAVKKSMRKSAPEIRLKTVLLPESTPDHLEQIFEYSAKKGIAEVFFLPFEDYQKSCVMDCRFEEIQLNNLEKYRIRSNVTEFMYAKPSGSEPVQDNTRGMGPKCFYPWYNLLISAEGNLGPCCNTARSRPQVAETVMDCWNEGFMAYRQTQCGVCEYCSNHTPALWKNVSEWIQKKRSEPGSGGDSLEQ